MDTNSSELSRKPFFIVTSIVSSSVTLSCSMLKAGVLFENNFKGKFSLHGGDPKIARGVCSSWNVRDYTRRTMSRAVLAEAVLSNVLYYIHNTKHIRHGNAISCRNFLMSVCFHKQSFPQEAHSARNISEQTSINRKTLAIHVKSQQLLRNIRYKPFAKGSASNYWGKRAVCTYLFVLLCPYHVFPKNPDFPAKKITINANVDC